MPKQIIWSPLSQNDFLAILDYLKENWDNKVVQGFIEITASSLSQNKRAPVWVLPHTSGNETRANK